MTQLTEADYEINVETLMASMGIDPATVAADTAKLAFLSGKAVLTYTVMRAVPPRLLGVAILRSATAPEEETADQPVADIQEPPRPVTRIRAAKKTTKKAVPKK